MLHKSTIGCCCVFGSLCEIRNSDLDAAEKCCQPQVGQSDVHLRCDNRNEIWTGCPANMRTETCILTHIVHNTYSWKFKLTHSRDKRVNKISRSRSALGIMKYRRRSACDCQTNSIRTTTGRHLYRLPYLRVNNNYSISVELLDLPPFSVHSVIALCKIAMPSSTQSLTVLFIYRAYWTLNLFLSDESNQHKYVYMAMCRSEWTAACDATGEKRMQTFFVVRRVSILNMFLVCLWWRQSINLLFLKARQMIRICIPLCEEMPAYFFFFLLFTFMWQLLLFTRT